MSEWWVLAILPLFICSLAAFAALADLCSTTKRERKVRRLNRQIDRCERELEDLKLQEEEQALNEKLQSMRDQLEQETNKRLTQF